MLTASSIFIELIYSTLVSDLYGLMQHILYLICVTPYRKLTIPLVKNQLIANGTLYCVSYFYTVWLLIMTLSPNL